MTDRQFNPLGSATAPAEWVLPASLQILLKNVYASFDGSGAAGSFVPALTIKSDSGHTVGTYPCATTVAAGGSADVTWFPGVGGGGAGGDYIFLSEQVVANDGDPLGFSGIPQSYRHLVVELTGGTNGGAGEADLLVAWNGYSDFGWAALESDTSGLNGYYKYDDLGVPLKYLFYELGPAVPMAVIELRFPYYALANTAKSVVGVAAGYNDTGDPIYSASGGQVSTDYAPSDTDPITSLTFTIHDTSGYYDWAAGSRASLYGIR